LLGDGLFRKTMLPTGASEEGSGPVPIKDNL